MLRCSAPRLKFFFKVREHPKAKREPLTGTFGWDYGEIPKFSGRHDFHRQLIMRRLLTQLVKKDHVITVGAKAPALRLFADEAVTLAKRGDTDARQRLAYFLNDPLMVDKAFDEFPRRFADLHSGYTMITKLHRRRKDRADLWFVEYKLRELSDSHKGEDYSVDPERFFLPAKVHETEKGIQRPPHLHLAFDRWASRFKTDEFHHWWKLRHAKLRYWGYRGVQHPIDVEPLWSEKQEEEWQNEMMANEDVNLDSPDLEGEGEGSERAG